MSLPNVNIILQNGNLGGLIAFAEGVAGMIGTGVAVNSKIQLADPRQVFSLEDAIAIGITENDNPVAYRHVKEFYDEAGSGRELYIMLVADTVNQTTMWDITEAAGIKKMLDYAQGRIRLAASFFEPDSEYDPVLTTGIDGDVHTAIVKAQATAVAYALEQAPFRALIEGRDFQGVPATLTDLREGSANRVAVMIGGSADDGSCSVGLVKGRLAKLPVQRKISRVKDGPLNLLQAFVGDEPVDDFSGIAAIHDKGYIVPRTIIGKTGYFASDDPTAAPATDDYSFIARGRVIDKAHVLAYLTYVNELNDEVLVDDQGRLDVGYIRYMETIITNQIKGSMVNNNEISGVRVFIDPEQDVISTNKVSISLFIIPVGYASEIEVLLGFQNPNQ